MIYCGIDFGTYNLYVTVSQSEVGEDPFSSITTLHNITGKGRGIISLMGFRKEQTYCCEQAISNYRVQPESFVPFVKQYLGIHSKDLPGGVNYDMLMSIKSDNEGYPLFEVSTNGIQKEFITPEIVCSKVFNHVFKLIQNAKTAFTGDSVTVAIPVTFTSKQKESLFTSMHCADYKHPVFIYDIQAISLQYGYYKMNNGAYKQSSETVMFVDVGYAHSCVFCSSFSDDAIRIQNCASTTTCSGKVFEKVLLEMIEKALVCEYSVNLEVLHQDKRQMVVIYLAMEKAKREFSLEGVDSISVQFTLRDSNIDAEITIDKAEFDKECEERKIINNLILLCKKCVHDTNRIDRVELVGSSARLVIIREAINQFIVETLNKSMKAETTMNMEEAVSQGCCLYSMMGKDGLKSITLTLPTCFESFTISNITCNDTNRIDETAIKLLKQQSDTIDNNDKEARKVYDIKQDIGHILESCLNELKGTHIDGQSDWFEEDIKDYIRVIQNELTFGKNSASDNLKYDRLKHDAEKVQSIISQYKMDGKKRVICLDPFSGAI